MSETGKIAAILVADVVGYSTGAAGTGEECVAVGTYCRRFRLPISGAIRLKPGRRYASLREFGVTAIMTESDRYDPAAIDQTHQAGLRFYAGVACF